MLKKDTREIFIELFLINNIYITYVSLFALITIFPLSFGLIYTGIIVRSIKVIDTFIAPRRYLCNN